MLKNKINKWQKKTRIWWLILSGIGYAVGKTWHTNRRFSVKTLKDFGVGKMKLSEQITVEVEHFLSELEKTEGKPTVVDSYLNISIANIIFKITAGIIV